MGQCDDGSSVLQFVSIDGLRAPASLNGSDVLPASIVDCVSPSKLGWPRLMRGAEFTSVFRRTALAQPRRRRTSQGLPITPSEAEALRLVQSQGARATCFFNNKGGVGKTTLVANLAAELALSFGAKVLVVDADPQCNLTQYALGDEEALELYASDDPSSVYSVIRPLSLGKGYGTELPIRKTDNFGFDIIVGDPRLALQEDLLANDWRDAKGGGMRGIRTTYVFADLVQKAKANYDFVFFDMGPSLGAINRSVLLAMDFFVVPMSIDIFSSWAIKNIGSTVSVWQKELKTGLALAEDPSEIPSLASAANLRFLGYVTQQHRERTEVEISVSINEDATEAKDMIHVLEKRKTRIVQAYQDISNAFPKDVEQYLHGFYDSDKIKPHLGNVKNLGSLAPKSQSQHAPMMLAGGTGRFVQLRKEAKTIYRGIANRFLENASLS